MRVHHASPIWATFGRLGTVGESLIGRYDGQRIVELGLHTIDADSRPLPVARPSPDDVRPHLRTLAPPPD